MDGRVSYLGPTLTPLRDPCPTSTPRCVSHSRTSSDPALGRGTTLSPSAQLSFRRRRRLKLQTWWSRASPSISNSLSPCPLRPPMRRPRTTHDQNRTTHETAAASTDTTPPPPSQPTRYPCPYCRHHLNEFVSVGRERDLYPVEYLFVGATAESLGGTNGGVWNPVGGEGPDLLSYVKDGKSARLFVWKLHNAVSSSICELGSLLSMRQPRPLRTPLANARSSAPSSLCATTNTNAHATRTPPHRRRRVPTQHAAKPGTTLPGPCTRTGTGRTWRA